MNIHRLSDLGNVKEGEAGKNLGNLIIIIRLFRLIEATDMKICIQTFPANLLTISINGKGTTLLCVCLFQLGESFQRTTVFVARVCPDVNSLVIKP